MHKSTIGTVTLGTALALVGCTESEPPREEGEPTVAAYQIGENTPGQIEVIMLDDRGDEVGHIYDRGEHITVLLGDAPPLELQVAGGIPASTLASVAEDEEVLAALPGAERHLVALQDAFRALRWKSDGERATSYGCWTVTYCFIVCWSKSYCDPCDPWLCGDCCLNDGHTQGGTCEQGLCYCNGRGGECEVL
jgi:hypothetical protein